MQCLNCHSELAFAENEKIPEFCPECGAGSGYRQYAYSQTDPQLDKNNAKEQQARTQNPGSRHYYVQGMCFANTLLWMKLRKQEGTKDLDIFRREYVDCMQQDAYYPEFIKLMQSQDQVIDTLGGSLNFYVNFDVYHAKPNAIFNVAKNYTLSMQVDCNSCGFTAKSPYKQGVKPNANCATCTKVGTVVASVICSDCNGEVLIGNPIAHVPACKCKLIWMIQPTSTCRSPTGQTNQNIAHEKKRQLYKQCANSYGLKLESYNNGFAFDQNIDILVNEMFALEGTHQSGYLGALSFEGDDGNAHVTSFWIRKGWIGFFEPNFGEFLFPSKYAFKSWFTQLLDNTSWPQSQIYYNKMRDGWYVALFS